MPHPDKDVAGGERTDNGRHHAIPEDPQAEPQQAVEAIKARVAGDGADSTGRDEQEDVTPAFEQNLDPPDQGSAEATPEQSG